MRSKWRKSKPDTKKTFLGSKLFGPCIAGKHDKCAVELATYRCSCKCHDSKSDAPQGGKAEYNPTPRRHTKESSARHSAGQPTQTPQCAKGGGKPSVHRRMPGAGLSRRCSGKAPSDMPAFQPYWGKPAVRNDRGDSGNVGIIRSPLRATVLPDCGGRSAMVVPTATVTSMA